MRSWRRLDTGPASGACNMAVDEALIQSVAGGGRPVLRFYRWDPPAVSLGYGQDLQRELDPERCRAAGIDIVRRPTGGRAVLHWEELTYSVVCAVDDPQVGGSVEVTTRRIGACLVAGLQRAGVPAELERAGRQGQRSRGPAATLPCFSSASRAEVTCAGRKLVGSAQRRMRGVILQHGSLLTGPAHRRLVELIPGLSGSQRQEWLDRLMRGSIQLDECCPGIPAWPRLVDALAQGFAAVLPAVLEPDGLAQTEALQAAELVESRYRHAERLRADRSARAPLTPPETQPVAAVC